MGNVELRSRQKYWCSQTYMTVVFQNRSVIELTLNLRSKTEMQRLFKIAADLMIQFESKQYRNVTVIP